MAVRQRLQIQDPDFCHCGISNPVRIRDKCMNVVGDYAKKMIMSEINELYLTSCGVLIYFFLI